MRNSIKLDLTSAGNIRQRESQTLEFKRGFALGDALLDYSRTMVAMANNQGGAIVFGVQDSPHLPIGLKDDRFNEFDQKELSRAVLNHFSECPEFRLYTITVGKVVCGVIEIDPHPDKPIICTKKNDKKSLREGAVYFRYRAETTEIRFPEFKALLQREKDKERDLWIKHIQSIATIGPRSVELFDLQDGSMTVGPSKILIDKNVLNKVKFIKEGSFSEKDGAPTLRLIGDLEGVVDADTVVFNESAYPYTFDMLKDMLGIDNRYSLQVLLEHLGVKGDNRFHTKIGTGKTGSVHKYSSTVVDHLRDHLRKNKGLIDEARAAYRLNGGRNSTKR